VQGDQCLDAPCFQAKVTAHIDREIAARPDLVTIETAWQAPKEQRPGALQKPKAVKAKADATSKPKPTAVKAPAKKKTTRKKAA